MEIALKPPDDPELQFILPALYHVLDPMGLPSQAEVETISLAKFVDMICVSFRSLIALEIPPGCFTDLWARVWECFNFIHTYLDCFPRTTIELRLVFILLLARFQTHSPDATPILAKSGLRFAIARSLRAFFGAQGLTVPDRIFTDMCRVIGSQPTKLDAATVEEFADGAGGIRQLASLVVGHIGHFPRRTDPSSRFYLDSALKFVLAFDIEGPGTPFIVALPNVGIIKVLCDTLCTLPAASEGMPSIMSKTLTILYETFILRNGRHNFIDALKAGFLRGLIAYITLPDGQSAHVVKVLLSTILPPSTVYHSVPTAMKPALAENRFLKVAKLHIELMDHFDADEYETSLACDNIKAKCQAIHWREGGHRALSRSHAVPVTTYFLRTILYKIYEHAKAGILVSQAKAFALDPPQHLRTIFDFSKDVASVSFSPIEDSDGPLEGSAAVLRDYVSRAVKSEGLMDMHMVVLRDGGYRIEQIIPLRSSSSRIRDGLTQIMSEVSPEQAASPELPEVIVQKIGAFSHATDAEGDPYQIH
ncbi:hypothetical protein FB451DRAFT_1164122 [Mycena latifolia]|nr:hypothetical protein FB451DRAFT_1164122 [Mycena latifolia]